MRLAKRALDIVAAAGALVVLSPVMLSCAIAVKAQDGGPVFYRHRRVGTNGIDIDVLKFRSMVTDADRKGGALTVGADSRVTKVGAFLRHYKLDELPQLFNVLFGNMSLVGPRPEVRRYVDFYTPEQRKVLDYVPGITDPASVAFVNESEILGEQSDPDAYYKEQIMPAKIAMNLEYARGATFRSDIGILLRTALCIVDRRPRLTGARDRAILGQKSG